MAAKRKGVLAVFRVAGIDIEIDYSWGVIFLLVLFGLAAGYFPQVIPGYAWFEYWMVGLTATVLFFASVVVHELSHAMMANRFGHRVSRITLFIFGGMAHLSAEPQKASEEFQIAVVGPLTSLVLGVLFWAIPHAVDLSSWRLWSETFQYLGLINIALAVFNLLPGFPLDGGRILRAVFWWQSGDVVAATARAGRWATGVVYGLIFLGALEILYGALLGGIWLILIAMFLRSASIASVQNVTIERILGAAHVRDIMVREPLIVRSDASVAEVVENYFLRFGYAGFPVVRDGHAVGLISLGQVQQCPSEARATRQVESVMRGLDDSVTIAPSATVLEALHKMTEQDTGRLLVMEGDRLAGLITRSGVARFLQMKSRLEAPVELTGRNNV
jgi:Zn-dependent protease